MRADSANKYTKFFLIFFSLSLIPIIFGLYTGHVWEDWYITYRNSKNFAAGFELSYTPGVRVHSFTSPLGTLVPTLIACLVKSHPDEFAMWIFRVISSLAFGAALLIMLTTGRRLIVSSFSLFFLMAMLAFDAKSIDFTINGMETAFILFFLAISIATLLAKQNKYLLAVGWAGLMWTRPDSFIYIIGLCGGYLLFLFPSYSIGRKKSSLYILMSATILSLLLYLPWLLWSLNYYGTFIPHSVVAKGLSHSLTIEAFARFLAFPILSLIHPLSFDQVFLPPYASGAGDWPPASHLISRVLSWVATFSFLIPGLNKITRALSFSVFLAQLYLNFGMPYAFPWYFPPVTVLSILVLALLLDQILSASYSRAHIYSVLRVPQLSRIFSSILILFSLSLTILAAYQLKNQQQIIEDGHRKEIGLWLKDNAKSSADTVYVECSGYIGYFSNLDLHHYPGLTSPEFVAARKKLGTDSWPKLIRYLKSDWLVLRPTEVKYIEERDPDLLKTDYEIAKIFDVSDEVAKLPLMPGRYYLEYDQTFVVYRKKGSVIKERDPEHPPEH